MDYKLVTDFELKQNEGGWTLTKWIGFDVESIEIPTEIDGKKITAVGEALFKDSQTLKAVKFANGIKVIEDMAFSKCKNLENVVLPQSIKELGNSTFCDCENLESIALPQGIESIGNNAFSAAKIKTLTMPDTIIKMGDGIFSSCPELYEVKLSENLTAIPAKAFYSCESLTTVSLPSNLETIGNSSFSNCKALTEISLPQKLKTIGEKAFYRTKIKEITFPDTLETIEKEAFRDTDIDFLEIPKNVKLIATDAFNGCSKLKHVFIMPGSTVGIEEGAFFKCNLSGLYIPSTVTNIQNIFWGEYAFTDSYDAIIKDESGNTVRDMWGKEVSEKKFVFHEGEEEKIPSELIAYCEINSAFMKFAKGKGIKCAEYPAESIEECIQKTKQEEKERFYTLFFGYDKSPHLCTVTDSDGARILTLSKSVKVIKKNAFWAISAPYIVCFEKGSQLEKIESEAFCYYKFCPLYLDKPLILPPSVKLIEKDAFKGCDYLKVIKIPSTCKVEEGAFIGGSIKKIVYYKPSKSAKSPFKGIIDKIKSIIKK